MTKLKETRFGPRHSGQVKGVLLAEIPMAQGPNTHQLPLVARSLTGGMPWVFPGMSPARKPAEPRLSNICHSPRFWR